jgi:hypothetical protein
MKIFANCSTVHVIYFMNQNQRETNKYRPEGGGICWSTPDCRSSCQEFFQLLLLKYWALAALCARALRVPLILAGKTRRYATLRP